MTRLDSLVGSAHNSTYVRDASNCKRYMESGYPVVYGTIHMRPYFCQIIGFIKGHMYIYIVPLRTVLFVGYVYTISGLIFVII